MKQFLIKIFIGVTLLLIFIFCYGLFCDFFFADDRFLDRNNKKAWVLSLKNNQYDYAVLGSSRAFGAFDMTLLDSLTGWKGVNIASDGSGFKDNFLILNHVLKFNKIKILFLQVDLLSLNSSQSFSNEFHAFSFLPYWQDSVVRQVLKEEVNAYNNTATDYFPFWRYFYFNKYFSPKEVMRRYRLSKNKVNTFELLQGGKISSRLRPALSHQEIKPNKIYQGVDENDLTYLKRIIRVAKVNGIKVCFFTAPQYRVDHTYLKQRISSFNLPHILPDQSMEDNPAYFSDGGHINEWGRYRYTIDFHQKLVEKR